MNNKKSVMWILSPMDVCLPFGFIFIIIFCKGNMLVLVGCRIRHSALVKKKKNLKKDLTSQRIYLLCISALDSLQISVSNGFADELHPSNALRGSPSKQLPVKQDINLQEVLIYSRMQLLITIREPQRRSHHCIALIY